MKKQTLRLLSFVLIFSMLVSYIQLPAIAQDGEQKSAYLISFVNEESAYDYVGNSAEAQLIAVTPPLVVADITSSQAESLSEEDFVESVEEDIFVHANTEEDIFVYANTGTVEDGDILHWNAEAVGAKSAHEAGFKGSGVKVAVLDSGVDLYSEVMVKDGIDFVDPENGDGDDMTGHGTAVTGIIAAPDDGEGVLGIAPQADIYSVRVLDDENKAPISRIIAGIDWCIEKKVDIINMSFGTSQYSALLEEKIEQAAEAGILMVSSAGNGDSVEYPAKFPEVIAVSSLTSSMILSDSSASGEEVEISAPGENIYTTSLIGGYGAFSGTSIAAPHVTAAAAVLLSKDTSKPTDFIRELLSASAKETSDTDSCGNGILDITYALDLYDDFAENYTQPEYIPTQNPAPVETFEEKDIYVTGSWSSAGHNGLADNYYDDAGRNIRFPLLIKEVSKKVDEKKGGNVAFHGNLNYVVTSKLLFEIARNYKTEGVSSFTHINYRSDLARFFQTAKVNYYYIMIEDITELLDDLDSESIAVSENDKKKGATDFVSVSEKTSTIVFGILFRSPLR